MLTGQVLTFMLANHLENWHSGCFTAPQMPYNNLMFNTPTMNDTINELTVTKSLRLLCNGFKSEFATFAYADERMTELLHELASEFVDANIPVVDEDNQVELGMMLLESLDIIAR